jgi:hypothetical protein
LYQDWVMPAIWPTEKRLIQSKIIVNFIPTKVGIS